MKAWRAITIASALVATFGGVAAAEGVPQPGSPPAEVCRTGFGPGAFGGYLPEGETKAGKATAVDLIWESGQLAGAKVAEAVSCVSINGELAEGLAASLGPVDNDGRQPHAITVPAGTPPGAKVCERGLLLGQNLDATSIAVRTDPVCFTLTGATRAAAAAPAPTAVPRPTDKPASSRSAPAAAAEHLPRTGTGSHMTLLAGLLFLAGGAAVMAGRRHDRHLGQLEGRRDASSIVSPSGGGVVKP